MYAEARAERQVKVGQAGVRRPVCVGNFARQTFALRGVTLSVCRGAENNLVFIHGLPPGSSTPPSGSLDIVLETRCEGRSVRDTALRHSVTMVLQCMSS
jgi:hypothetical protein